MFEYAAKLNIARLEQNICNIKSLLLQSRLSVPELSIVPPKHLQAAGSELSPCPAHAWRVAIFYLSALSEDRTPEEP